MNAPEYAFSLSDDNMHSWHINIKDAIQEMRVYDDDCRTLYMGTLRRFTHFDFFDAEDDIIENMQNRAYDDAGDYADTYLADIPKDKITDLQRMVSEWFDANVVHPDFYVVENILEIEVQLDAAGEYLLHRRPDDDRRPLSIPSQTNPIP